MFGTPAERGRSILDAILGEAQRMEHAGHGLDYTCALTEPQFDDVLAALGDWSCSIIAPSAGIPFRIKTCVVGRSYGICLASNGKARDRVELSPGFRYVDWTQP